MVPFTASGQDPVHVHGDYAGHLSDIHTYGCDAGYPVPFGCGVKGIEHIKNYS